MLRFMGSQRIGHAIPFTRGSSQPRDRTQVSHIAGRFFTNIISSHSEGCLFTLLILSFVVQKLLNLIWRSEERRVGKECRSRWSPYH